MQDFLTINSMAAKSDHDLTACPTVAPRFDSVTRSHMFFQFKHCIARMYCIRLHFYLHIQDRKTYLSAIIRYYLSSHTHAYSDQISCSWAPFSLSFDAGVVFLDQSPRIVFPVSFGTVAFPHNVPAQKVRIIPSHTRLMTW